MEAVGPFLQFRVWCARGPRVERLMASVAAVLLVALVAWAFVPVTGDGEEQAAVAGLDPATAPQGTSAAPQGAATSGSPNGSPAAAGPGTGATSAGASAAAGTPVVTQPGAAVAAPAADRCSGLRATDQGVTPTDVFVGVSLINLAGELGNETFGLRGNIDEVVQAAVAGINAEGGVACRKLRVKTYKTNPIDSNDQRAKCLQMVGDKPFAVLDIFAFGAPVTRSCFIEAKVPFQASSVVNEEEGARGFPYVYSNRVSNGRAARTWVAENAALGTFKPSNGFRTLGITLDECDPSGNAELLKALDGAGVNGDHRAVFTIRGCGPATPADIGQAVVQHRNAGASHVFLAAVPSNMQNYVRQADSLSFKPKYLISDMAQLPGIFDWSDGFDGAVAITNTRVGEMGAAVPNALLQHCNEWMKKAGVEPQTKEGDQIPGVVCDEFRLFIAAANAAAPTLVRDQFLNGLARVGRFQSANVLDSVFDRPRKIFGGDYVRAIQWRVDCKCWKILDREPRLSR